MNYTVILGSIVVVAITSLILVELFSIYVPDNFERPIYFRISAIMFTITASIAKLSSWFIKESEPVIFRRLQSVIRGISLPYQSSATRDVLITSTNRDVNYQDVHVGSRKVRVRIYDAYTARTCDDKKRPVLFFFHGGAFVMGSIDRYHLFLCRLTTSLKNFVIISVDYKLAPEHCHPSQLNDCIDVVNEILANRAISPKNSYEIDLNRVVFAGDSAGGNIAAVLTQTFTQSILKTKPKGHAKIPKLQVLIYPWVQFFNFCLPSCLEYMPKNVLASSVFSISKPVYWYLGEQYITKEMDDFIRTNGHWILMPKKDLETYCKRVNVDLIPEKFKMKKYYQTNKQESVAKPCATNVRSLDPCRSVGIFPLIDADLKRSLRALTDVDISPALADDEILKNLPTTYFVILEWDPLKDENLIYAQRLKDNNVNVHVRFYDNAFHGILLNKNYSETKKIFDDLVDFILKHV